MQLKRFRFHLSTAVVLMLLAALLNGYWVKHYLQHQEPWRAAWENRLNATVSIEVQNGSVLECLQTTIGTGNCAYGKKIKLEAPVTLKLEKVSARDALDQVCEQTGSKWCLQQGAVCIYSKDETPPPSKTYLSDLSLNEETRKQLSRQISACFPGTPLDEELHFLETLSRIRIVIDPKCKIAPPEQSMVFNEMALEYVLSWCCYYADTEWRLRKRLDGTDEIYVTPKTAVSLKADSK